MTDISPSRHNERLPKRNHQRWFFLIIWLSCVFPACYIHSESVFPGDFWQWETSSPSSVSFGTYTAPFTRPIPIKDYFATLDSVIEAYDSLTAYALDEHLLVQANPWLIDTLAATDYYVQAERGNFVYDQRTLLVIPANTRLLVPDSMLAVILNERRQQIIIDLNIPEFRLRILQGERLIESFVVRVGQNKVGLIPILNRSIDWRTQLGEGQIVSYNRNPLYHNLSTGRPYEYTRRDDGKTTLMPQIPSLEPEIDGVCSGQLIHATTNPNTLGKAYSHGCVGVREGDAWRIYYYAPIGTRVRFRYDLNVLAENGDSLALKDIYGLFREVKTQYPNPINLP